jgi:hypothetical protein
MHVLSDGVYNYYYRKFWFFTFLIKKEPVTNLKQIDSSIQLLEINANYLKNQQVQLAHATSELMKKIDLLIEAASKPMPIHVTVSQPQPVVERSQSNGIKIWQQP